MLIYLEELRAFQNRGSSNTPSDPSEIKARLELLAKRATELSEKAKKLIKEQRA